MASFSIKDYERIIAIARELAHGHYTNRSNELAQELFDMAQDVLGQGGPPLFSDPEDPEDP